MKTFLASDGSFGPSTECLIKKLCLVNANSKHVSYIFFYLKNISIQDFNLVIIMRPIVSKWYNYTNSIGSVLTYHILSIAPFILRTTQTSQHIFNEATGFDVLIKRNRKLVIHGSFKIIVCGFLRSIIGQLLSIQEQTFRRSPTEVFL